MKIAIKGEKVVGERPDMTLALIRNSNGKVALVGWNSDECPETTVYWCIGVFESNGLRLISPLPEGWPVNRRGFLEIV